jgi:hypothetical protein
VSVVVVFQQSPSSLPTTAAEAVVAMSARAPTVPNNENAMFFFILMSPNAVTRFTGKFRPAELFGLVKQQLRCLSVPLIRVEKWSRHLPRAAEAPRRAGQGGRKFFPDRHLPAANLGGSL